MVKSKRIVHSFIKFLFREYNVPMIPIRVHWYKKSLVVGDYPCFGVCITYDDEPERNEIHVVAGTKYGTKATLKIIAHEFVHYLQWLNGKFNGDECDVETIAEANGQALVCKFLQNRRKNGIHIDGVLTAWEPPKEDGERREG